MSCRCLGKHPDVCAIALALVLVSTSLLDTARAQLPPSGPERVVERFLQALGSADLDGVVSAFAEDATAFLPLPSAVGRVRGRREIRAAFAPFLEQLRSSRANPPYLSLEPRDLLVQRYDGTAIVTFHLGGPPDPAAESASLSLRSFVLRQFEDGWAIVHMHGSNVRVQPQDRK